MIPILYSSTETDFNSNGLGLLNDCITATCKEARNGEYEIAFTYPVDGVHFAELETSRIVKAIPSDGERAQLFRIYYVSKPLNGRVQFKAEHISYQLKHIPVAPYTATSALETFARMKENAQENCPFEFWTDNTTVANFELKVPASCRSILGGMEGSILDVYGGEYKFDNYTVRLYRQRGQDTGVVLRYGKNITDIKQEKNIGDTITGVMPFWKGQNADGNDTYVDLPEKIIRSENAGNFPYKRTVALDCSAHFQSEPTVEQIRSYAQSYIRRTGVGVPKISIDISFVALWQSEEYKNIANLERVRLCDTVQVEFEPLNISATAKVVETEYDILKEKYISITLGDARTNLAGVVKADIDAVSSDILNNTVSPSFMQAAIQRATELIRGGLGGYVVFTENADGEPQEILIMDTDDIQTAVNVIRMNRNGIGFSSTGYDGPFTSAWTIDGHFNADFITAGTINAALIKAGLLSDGQGKNYWNMQTGEFSLSANSTVGGKTVSTIASSAASSAVNGQTQESIFNKLTNGGQTQGIKLVDGKLYLNGTYLQAGIINIKNPDDVSTFYANTETGVVHIVAKTFKLVSGDTTKTIPEIANERASAAVNAQTQESIFNKLTNNGETQGIYLDGGKLYINGEFIKAKSVSASLIKGGVLELGGSGNGNGSLVVYGASGSEIGRFDKDGLIADEKFKLSRDGYDFFVCDDFSELKTLYGINYNPPGFKCGNYYMTMTPNDGSKIIDHYTPSEPFYIEPNYEGQMWTYGHIDDYFMAKNDMPNHLDSGTYMQRIYRFKKDYIIRIGKRQSASNGAVYMTNSMYLALNDKHFYWGSNKFYPDENTLPSTTDGATRELKLNETMFSFRVSASIFGYVNGDGLYIKGGSKYIRLTDSYTQINGKTVAFESSSARRYKHDIKPIEDKSLDPHRLLTLPVVQFKWNANHTLQYEDMRDKTIPGIIAEDVEAVYPSAVIHNADGQVESWDERRLIPGMLALIQEQDEKIKKLEARLTRLEELLK